MDRDTVIALAREAGYIGVQFTSISTLERFAALVAAHEREECAQIAKQWDADHPSTNYGGCIANLIRSRGT